MSVVADRLDEVRAYLAARDDADPEVAPEMRSVVRSVVGAGEVVLLLHGLTASPPAWRDVADAVVSRGRSVVIPRLPRHGHRDRLTGALRGLTAHELTADLDAIVDRLAATGARVTVAGHSLGGLLALHLASHDARVARAVAIAPFLGAAMVPPEVHRIAWAIVRRLPNVFLWWNPLKRERLMPAHGYPRYPSHALTEALRLADALPERGSVTAEVDIVVNAAENSVNNRRVLHLARAWRERGASVAVHRLAGLAWSHDIIEPNRRYSGRAREAIVTIVAGAHVAGERVHQV